MSQGIEAQDVYMVIAGIGGLFSSSWKARVMLG